MVTIMWVEKLADIRELFKCVSYNLGNIRYADSTKIHNFNVIIIESNDGSEVWLRLDDGIVHVSFLDEFGLNELGSIRYDSCRGFIYELNELLRTI